MSSLNIGMMMGCGAQSVMPAWL